MDCEGCRRLMPLAVGGDVSAATRAAVEAHAAVCPACRLEFGRYRSAGDALAAARDVPEPPGGWGGIWAGIAEHLAPGAVEARGAEPARGASATAGVGRLSADDPAKGVGGAPLQQPARGGDFPLRYLRLAAGLLVGFTAGFTVYHLGFRFESVPAVRPASVAGASAWQGPPVVDAGISRAVSPPAGAGPSAEFTLSVPREAGRGEGLGAGPSAALGAGPSAALGAGPSTALGAGPSASLGAGLSASLGAGWRERIGAHLGLHPAADVGWTVRAITPGGAAAASGLQIDDALQAINDADLPRSPEEMDDLMGRLLELPEMRVRVRREGGMREMVLRLR